jgi:hypothetical protein
MNISQTFAFWTEIYYAMDRKLIKEVSSRRVQQ